MADIAAYLTQELGGRLQALGVSLDGPLAVAVSGGPDSLALALLLKDCPLMTALTVDHGLRAESSHEAEYVAGLSMRAGFRHETLRWHGDKPNANLQAEARVARYRLMADWCRENEVSYLLTAHHQEDQAETLLLRLGRGSGVYGLAAMPEISEVPGYEDIALVRPLLAISKALLRNYLLNAGVEWVEDPSNLNSSFERVKVRQFLQSPPLDGYSVERLAATARRMRRSREALEFYERQWLCVSVMEREPAYCFLSYASLAAAPEDVVLRGLAAICRQFAGADYTPRMEKLERLLDAMRDDAFAGATLSGTVFKPDAEGVIICRELSSCVERSNVQDGSDWDNRFEISAIGDTRGLEIGVLGDDGWKQAVTKWPDLRGISVPHIARLVQPGIFDAQQLRALPLMGYSDLKDVTLHLSRKPLIRSKNRAGSD